MANTGRILDIHADYKLAPHMVVFSHGFGVDRTSRGLFTDIVEALPEDYGYVLFDYNDIDGTNMRMSTLVDQQRMLLSIIARLSEQSEVIDISLVAHSMGCVVAAVAEPPELKHVVMLAPPLTVGERTREYFTTKPGVTKQDDLWIVPRRDGSTSYIPDALFDELAEVQCLPAFLNYAAVQPFELLIAADDEVLGDVDYNDLALHEAITALTIDEADHNFTGSSRSAAINAILDWLNRA